MSFSVASVVSGQIEFDRCRASGRKPLRWFAVATVVARIVATEADATKDFDELTVRAGLRFARHHTRLGGHPLCAVTASLRADDLVVRARCRVLSPCDADQRYADDDEPGSGHDRWQGSSAGTCESW